MLKIFDERAREVLLKDPAALHLRRDKDGEYMFQIVEGNKILAEGRYKTMELREAGLLAFEAGKKDKKKNIDVSLVHYSSANQHIEVGGQDSGAVKLIERLSSMNSRDLMKVVEGTVYAERATFVMRGAAAYELVKRKLREVEKFNTTKGAGIDSICNTLAKEVGIDGKTLYKDYRIFEEFGDRLVSTLRDTPERILPRELYAVAVCADPLLSSPTEVLDYFEEQREVTGGYFTDHARRDIKRVNEGIPLEEIRDLDGIERINKINEKKDRALPAERTTNIKILASPENNWLISQIIEKHASFSAWFALRGKEEFGSPPRRK